MSSEMKPFFTGNGTYKLVNPIVSKVGDYSPFYITIAVCSVILGCLIVLNIVCCYSKYSRYWLDRHTGNRWIVSIWSTTPHKQTPLDYFELQNREQLEIRINSNPNELQPYRETEVLPSNSQQPLTSSQEYLELHMRESDI